MSLTIRCDEYNVDLRTAGKTERGEIRGLALENCLSPKVDESTLTPCSHGCHTRTAMQGVHTGHVVGQKQVRVGLRNLLTPLYSPQNFESLKVLTCVAGVNVLRVLSRLREQLVINIHQTTKTH